jgi:hypothetical protein
LAWKLKVNIDKTNIVCFTNGRLPQNLQFTYSNSEIEIVKEFNYLGLLFNQEKIAFCVLHKWYIKRYTAEQIVDCFPVISLVQYDTIHRFISI